MILIHARNGQVFTFQGDVTTANAGPITITNGDLLTFSAGQTISSDGPFTQDGIGSVALAGTISTTNDDISFNSAIGLFSPVILSTGAGAGNITFNGTIDGLQDLTLIAGTGDILVNGFVGSILPLANIIISSATNVTVKDVTANSITQLNGWGTTSITGHLTTNGSQGIVLNGNSFFRNGNITTTNGGSLIITNSGLITGLLGNTTNIDGDYIQNGSGPVNLGGTINALNITFEGPIMLAADAVLNAPGNITITNTVDGTHDLFLDAGSGDVVISGDIGTNVALNSITALGRNLTIKNIGDGGSGVIGATNLTAEGQSINFSGTNYNANAQTYNSILHFNMTSGALTSFISSADDITFIGGEIILSSGTDLSINTFGGNITTGDIFAQSNNLRVLTLDAGSGDIQTGVIGVLNDHEFASVSYNAHDIILTNDLITEALSFSQTGILYAGGNIYTNNSPIYFPNPVILTASRTFSSGPSTGGDITFHSTLDGDVDNLRDLILNSFSRDIAFTGIVGSSHPLKSITISNARDVTTDVMTVNGFSQNSGSGTTTFGGTLTTTTFLGISLTGNNFDFNSPVITTGGGAILVHNSGTLTLSNVINDTGTFTQNGSGPTTFSGSIVAAQNVSFSGTVSLTGSPSIDTSSANQNITFIGPVEGPGDLSLTAGGGNITFGSNAGNSSRIGALVINSVFDLSTMGIRASSIDLISSIDLVTLNGDLNTNAPGDAIHLIGKNFLLNGSLITTGGGSVVLTNSGTLTYNAASVSSVDGSYTQNGIGPVNFAGILNTNSGNISFQSPLTMIGTGGIHSGSNLGISSIIDGSYNLSLSAALDINLNGSIGSNALLGALRIDNAVDVTASSINASSIAQLSGSGTTTFNGVVTTNASGGIQLTGHNFIFNSPVTTLNGGLISINNSGTLSLLNPIHDSGAFTQIGSGDIIFSSSIVAGQNVSFNGPIALVGFPLIDTSLANKNINLRDLGPGNLLLSAGNGDINFLTFAGSPSRLGMVNISSVGNLNMGSMNANTLSVSSISGTATLSGTINTDGAGNAVTLGGNNIVLSGAIVTTNIGSVIITNSGTLSTSLSNSTSISGSFTQNGSGPVNLSGYLTTLSDDISIASSTLLTGNANLNSGHDINFNSTVNGNHDLSLTAVMDLNLNGAIGLVTPLGAFRINNCTTVTAPSIKASSITQLGGTTSNFGTLTATGSGGIHLTGNDITRNGAWTTFNNGLVIIDNSGFFTSIASGNLNASGNFLQSGLGAVLLGNGLISENGSVSFSSPITLMASTSISSGSNGITFNSTVDGGFNLILSGNNCGNLTFIGNVGAIAPLGDVTVSTAGNVLFPSLLYASSFNLQAACGTATLYNVNGNGGNMNSLQINAAEIRFGGVINTNTGSFVSGGSILNLGLPVAINSQNSAFFNALGGNVGSSSSPILIHTLGQITAGSTYLVQMNGSSGDNTVHHYLPNDPYLIIFNGVVVYQRNPTPPPPPPPAFATVRPAPGFDSSYFNLANDFFFKTFYLCVDDEFFENNLYMYNEEPHWTFYGAKRSSEVPDTKTKKLINLSL